MKKFLLRLAILLVVVGGMLLYHTKTDYKIACKEPVDINAEGFLTDVSQLQKEMAVETNINTLVGPIMVETVTTRNRFSKTTDVYYHYVMPVFVGEEVYYIAYKVNESDTFTKNAVDKIAEVTMSFLRGETDYFGTSSISFSGGIVGVDNDIKQELVEELTEFGMFESEAIASKYVLDYSLENISRDGAKKFFYVNVIAVALGILILVGLLISTICGRKNAF